MTRQIELNAWINSSGAADNSWPRKGLEADAIFTLDHYLRAARAAHRGRFSNIFMSDRPQLLVDEATRPEQLFDPFVLFSALLTQVPDIGAIITATTSYSQPYTLARALQSLNLLFPGRVGWNIVTSWHPEIAANFSAESLPDRAARYAKAEEFVDVVLKLWNSWHYPWGQGEIKSFGDVRPIGHKGRHFNVAGALNLPAAPWGRPTLVQAGGSVSGMSLGARHADYIYAPLSSIEGSAAFRAELRAAARAFGRSESDLPKVVPPFSPILFSTEREVAAFRRAWVEDRVVTEAELQGVAGLLRLREGVALDRPMTEGDFASLEGAVLPHGVILAKRRQVLDAKQSLRQFAADEALPGRPGTPEDTVAFMKSYVVAEAVDGFTISALNLPDDLERFVDEVVPLLQAEGLSPRGYAGAKSLRCAESFQSVAAG